MALFRVDYSGRGELADRQQHLAQMMSRLQKISEEYNVAVFITNQMTADPGATLSFQVGDFSQRLNRFHRGSNIASIIIAILHLYVLIKPLGRPQKTNRWQYLGPRVHYPNRVAEGQGRDEDRQNLRQP